MKLLIGEDDPTIIDMLVRRLSREGCQTGTVPTCQELWDAMTGADAESWNILLLDRYLRDGDCLPVAEKYVREAMHRS